MVLDNEKIPVHCHIILDIRLFVSRIVGCKLFKVRRQDELSFVQVLELLDG